MTDATWSPPNFQQFTEQMQCVTNVESEMEGCTNKVTYLYQLQHRVELVAGQSKITPHGMDETDGEKQLQTTNEF